MSDDVTGWLHRNDAATTETFDLGARSDARRKAGARRKAYRRALPEVPDVAGPTRGRELSEWIQEEIRSGERFPSVREVRERGAEINREGATGNWLGARARPAAGWAGRGDLRSPSSQGVTTPRQPLETGPGRRPGCRCDGTGCTVNACRTHRERI